MALSVVLRVGGTVIGVGKAPGAVVETSEVVDAFTLQLINEAQADPKVSDYVAYWTCNFKMYQNFAASLIM